MTTGTASTIVVERGEVCRVTLNRPERLNALNDTVRRDMQAVVDDLREDAGTRVLVLAGAGRAFSAGADLKGSNGVSRSASSAERRIASAGWQRLLADIEALPQVTVARLQSHAIGGGALLALSCDLRVASADLRVCIPELSLGLPLAWAGLPRMVRELGLPMTREMVLTGRALDAADALACGFVTRVAAGDLDEAVESVVRDLLAMPAAPLAMARAALAAIGRHHPPHDLAWADADLLSSSVREPESAAAARAYINNRLL